MSTPASVQVEAVLYRVVVGVVITAIKLRFISIESQPKNIVVVVVVVLILLL